MMQKQVVWVFWVLRGLYERFGGVYTLQSIWFECFERSRVSLRALKVLRFQYHMTYKAWMSKGLFKIFGGV